MTKVQEFDPCDANAFQGATPFESGEAPLIDASDGMFLFVGCGTAVEAYESSLHSDDRSPGVWVYDVKFPTQAGCRIFLENLPRNDLKALLQIGFKRTS